MWIPTEKGKRLSAMGLLLKRVEADHGVVLGGYDELHAWSVKSLDAFWRLIVEYLDVVMDGSKEPAMVEIEDGEDSLRPALLRKKWFPNMRINVAEHLLRERSSKTAIVSHREDLKRRRSLTYDELYKEVDAVYWFLKGAGVAEGDVVAAMMPNIAETVVVMLAAVALGATWSSCSPDFGVTAVLDRFGQIHPKVLIVPDGYTYKAKVIDVMQKNIEISQSLPTLAKVVLVPVLHAELPPDLQLPPNFTNYCDVTADPKRDNPATQPMSFTRVSSTHPVYIMYSSGKSSNDVSGDGACERKEARCSDSSTKILFSLSGVPNGCRYHW